MLRAICIAPHVTESFTDLVVGHGELWSAQMLAAVLRKNGVDYEWMDTREIIVVNPSSCNQVDPDFSECEKRVEKWYSQSQSKTIIATGFIASTSDNIPTTLKRDGSDFSAAAMGALVRASQVTIWTDVGGVYSADPIKVQCVGCLIRILMDLNWDVLATQIYAVSEAVTLRTLSYQEAWEMSYFGANVLHPRGIIPLMQCDIPVVIRNVFNLSAPGTMICRPPENEDHQRVDSPLKGFATIDNWALINVEGTGMAGVPATANALSGAMKDVGANVIMASQISRSQRGPGGSVTPKAAENFIEPVTGHTDVIIILQLPTDMNVIKHAMDILRHNDIHYEVLNSYTEAQLINKFSQGGPRVVVATDHGAGYFLDKIASYTLGVVIGVPIHAPEVTGTKPEYIGISPKLPVVLVEANNAIGAAKLSLTICAFGHPHEKLGSFLG